MSLNRDSVMRAIVKKHSEQLDKIYQKRGYVATMTAVERLLKDHTHPEEKRIRDFLKNKRDKITMIDMKARHKTKKPRSWQDKNDDYCPKRVWEVLK